MGKLENFRIVFDQPGGVHFAGYWMTGSVRFLLNEPMNIRGVFLNLVGRAKVNWTKSSFNHSTEYRGRERYIDVTFQLSGEGSETILAPGQYNHAFKFLLPQNLPSSFEGEYGFVRYAATATIDRPRRFDHVITRPFTVRGCTVLNSLPENLKSRIIMPMEKEMSCCFFKSGTVDAEITINKRCFVPGETIYVSGVIHNRSDFKIKGVRCALKQYVKFMVPTKDELHTKKAKSYPVTAKLGNGKVRQGVTDSWSNVPLVIPALPPSRLHGCSIIDIIYFFTFYVNNEAFMETPIFVGIVPPRDSTSSINQSARPMR